MTLSPEQFNQLATKEDLKKELKKEFGNYYNKKEMDQKFDSVFKVVNVIIKDELKNYYTKSEMDQKFDLVLTAVDAVILKLDKMENAFVFNQAAHDRFEGRISRTEKQLGLSPYSFDVAKK